MGIFDNIFKNRKEKKDLAMLLHNQAPIFSNFGNDIYMSDFVNNAIDRIASEMAKVEVKSVVERDNSILVQNDDITRLFSNRPNPLQTAGDMLRNIEWLRRKNGHAFVYPQYVEIPYKNTTFRKYVGLYPLAVNHFNFGTDSDTGEWYVQMWMTDGTQWTFPYADILHFKWRRGANTVKGGGDDYGLSNDRNTLNTVQALDKTIQGIPKSIEAALSLNGVLTVKSMVDGEKLKKERDDFEEHILTSKSGIVATTLAGEFTPINKSAAVIPDNLLNFLKSTIQEKYGVSAAILSGDYNGDQNAAFYQTAIEDFLVEFEQEIASKMFTARELDVGHKIKGYYSKINYLTNKDKMELATIATNTGLMTLNEVGQMFGMSAYPEGNRRIMSLNYISADIADQYQLGERKENSIGKE